MQRARPHAVKLTRRALVSGLIGLPLTSRLLGETVTPTPARTPAELEAKAGGKLGVCLLDTATGETATHRAHRRFGMCSTFKVLLAGAVLREIDAGRLAGDRAVPFDDGDMVFYAPVTSEHLEQGSMTVLELAEATQVTSDNVAANLLLELLGGPEGFTRLLRESGDDTTRLDRYEPEMNLVPAGEVRDTTTPHAMAHSVARFVTGDLLSSTSRETLAEWMVATRTGRRRLRAGLPEEWRSGDKTGTGVAETMTNKYNDVAVVWPPERAPLVLAAYYEAPAYFDSIRPEDEAVLAAVGRWAAGLIPIEPATP